MALVNFGNRRIVVIGFKYVYVKFSSIVKGLLICIVKKGPVELFGR